MSDFDNTPKGKMRAKSTVAGWTDHEVLVYLLCAIKSADWQPNYNNAPVPDGRNANGCRQKINKVKNALRSETDALKAGEPLSTAAGGTPKKAAATPHKRKAKANGESNAGESTPKKGRGRPKIRLLLPTQKGTKRSWASSPKQRRSSMTSMRLFESIMADHLETQSIDMGMWG